MSRLTLALAGVAAMAVLAAAVGQTVGPVEMDGEMVLEVRGQDRNSPGLKILGQSGKMVLGRGSTPEGDPNRIVVVFDAIGERDASGAIVGRSGKRKHSINSFARTDFTITEWEDDEVQGIGAQSLTFSAPLIAGDTTLTVKLYMFTEDGVILNGNDCETEGDGETELDCEESTVEEGSMKFTIEVDDWVFCDSAETDRDEAGYCGNNSPDGEFIDFVIQINSKSKPEIEAPDDGEDGEDARSLRALKGGRDRGRTKGTPERPRGEDGRRKPQRFSMGGGAAMDFSTKVRVGEGDAAVWQDMEEGFPSFRESGSKNLYTFRFPKAQKIFYDPTIFLGANGSDDDDSSSGASTAGVAAAALAVAAAAVVALRE